MCTFPSYHKLPLRYPSFPAVVACQHKHRRKMNRNDSTFLSFTTLFFTLLLLMQDRMPIHVHEDRCITIYKLICKNQALLSDCAMTLSRPRWRLLQCSLPSSGQAALRDMCSDTAAAGLQACCLVLSPVTSTPSQSLRGQGPLRQSLGTQPFSTPYTNCYAITSSSSHKPSRCPQKF